ncbi:hypothetical protein ACWGDX_00155 [Streptomyces sp. NPDC055025]
MRAIARRSKHALRAVLPRGAAIPPCVEYSITPLGAKIADRLRGLVDLVEVSVTTVFAARDAYDARRP